MYSEAVSACCVYNMTHLTINSEKILGCAQTMHDEYKKTNPPAGVKYWTSGRWSESCGKYVWCPEKEVIAPDVKWKKGFPKTGAGECVAIHIGSNNPDQNGLFNAKCTDSMKLHCIEYDNWSLYN